MIIDPAIRLGVRKALHAFLAGEKFKLDTVDEALSRVQIVHSADGTKVAPINGEVATGSLYALLETHIRSLEESSGQDLPWLYGLLPTLLDDTARKSFLRKLQVIRERKIRSLEAWHEYELKRL